MKCSGRCEHLKITTFLTLLFWLLSAFPANADEHSTMLWQKLATPDHFAFMRHALAPGTGDPPGFSLADCSTQRNLSAQGRSQAKAIGEAFRSNNISGARVYSSQWCRCMETAKLLNLGEVKVLPVINSFFTQFQLREERTEGLRRWLRDQELVKPLILVSHQVNITSLTGIFPSSGEIVVMRRDAAGDLEVVGTIAIN